MRVPSGRARWGLLEGLPTWFFGCTLRRLVCMCSGKQSKGEKSQMGKEPVAGRAGSIGQAGGCSGGAGAARAAGHLWGGEPACTAPPCPPPPALLRLQPDPGFLPAFEVQGQLSGVLVCVLCAEAPAAHCLPLASSTSPLWPPTGCGPRARGPGRKQNKPALFPCQGRAGPGPQQRSGRARR